MVYVKKFNEFPKNIEIGGIKISLPDPPNKSKMGGYSLPTSKQKFTKIGLPNNWKLLTEVEKYEFADNEWDKRINGYWFYNNGKPTYITGQHYFYLNWWHIDIGYPEYRDRDRRWFIFQDFCFKDPDCFGFAYLKHRRDGATYRASCINYEVISRTKLSHGGIQSKTNTDAGKVFRTHVVMPWRRLPPFFKPQTEGKTFPKKSLNFFEPAEIITHKRRAIEQAGAMDSTIDYMPSVSESYDGYKLQVYHQDESGKTAESDVSLTWKIVKECLNIGKSIIGKAMLTTTVGNMTKMGGNNFKKIWDGSDYNERDLNNRTVSGLYRLFIPAYDGLEGFIDEYGISQEKPAKEFLINKRKGLEEKGDGEDLQEEKRLYPFTVEEAFRPEGAQCLFDIEKLNTRLDYLLWEKDVATRGDLVWKDDRQDSYVVWKPSKNGKFRSSYIPKKPNIVKRESGLIKPGNSLNFVAGCDPFDHNSTTSRQFSKGAGYVFMKFSPMDDMDKPPEEQFSHRFVVQYINRPPTAPLFYEDMLKMCFFYGCPILVENSKFGIVHYFKQRGYQKFLMNRPEYTHTNHTRAQKTEGIPGSKLLHEAIVEVFEEYIHEHWEKIDFTELIYDLMEFDPDNTTKHDATIASGLALIARTKKVSKTVDKINIGGFVKKYEISGNVSKRIA